MNEQESLSKMVAPGTRRPGKYREGVIQVHVTRACDKCCFGCTQGSNLAGPAHFISPEHFEQACVSLKGYFGVTGVFGGNPATHPQFDLLCDILAKHVPWEQRGLWCNNPLGHGKKMRETFNPAVSNLNVHLDRKAWDEFKRDWPEASVFGLKDDSRHSPPYVAMRDVLKKECPSCNGRGCSQTVPVILFCDSCGGSGKVYDEEQAWELISDCDINKHWSAMIGVFRGQLRAWFCELAGAQAMLHQDEPDYPDTGLEIGPNIGHCLETTSEENQKWRTYRPAQWWELPMQDFAHQVRKHCHECSIPLRGRGQLAQASEADEGVKEQVSATHESIYKPKRKFRKVELVTTREQLGVPLPRVTDYLKNAK